MVKLSNRSGRRLASAAALVVGTGLVSCESARVVRVVEGDCRDVYGADVCTYAAWDGTILAEFGVTFPLELAENVPTEMEMVWPPAPVAILDLPDGVEGVTGFSHFELNWEHHGHPPQSFMEPHFDFHFYSIPSDRLSQIDCNDPTKPDRLPAGYVLPDATDREHGVLTGLCVPSMGMHAMPEYLAESSDPFTATVLIGYYSGDVIFVEPMVSQAMLLEGEDFSLEVPSVPVLAETLAYPSRFRAVFDESSGEYRLIFSDFAGAQGQ